MVVRKSSLDQIYPGQTPILNLSLRSRDHRATLISVEVIHYSGLGTARKKLERGFVLDHLVTWRASGGLCLRDWD